MPASYLQPRRGTNGRRIMEHGSGEEMVAFYEAWVGREERIVADLTDALLPARRRRDVLAPLVDAAVGHVSEYYERKARLADRDVVAALDPRWLNPLERTFLWAWGWKPALVFRFADGAVAGGSSHQQQRRALERVRAATAEAERERTVRDVVGTLAPDQAGAFLAAMLRFHLGVHRAGRNWGSGNGGRRGL
uniref:DOG1 domain-containing protein n=1 Tax=Oryza glumipatula TaxID=40148 RepID=A0A0D9Y7D1_9ORYZ